VPVVRKKTKKKVKIITKRHFPYTKIPKTHRVRLDPSFRRGLEVSIKAKYGDDIEVLILFLAMPVMLGFIFGWSDNVLYSIIGALFVVGSTIIGFTKGKVRARNKIR
jgi:hypothetical protein